jgi:primosomal protein N' (replication factor Y)
MQAMNYVSVLVAEASYHGQESLTYGAEKSLPTGTIVTVPLRSKQVLGIVTGLVAKPTFAVKKIVSAAELPPMPTQLLQLLVWMQHYYPAPLGIITQHFLPRRLPKTYELEHEGINTPAPSLPPLTGDQQQALSALHPDGLHVLHGETGSGKTRIYIEAAQKQLEQCRSSIILTPEIGLTSQLLDDFRAVFGNHRIVVMHSQLTDSARHKSWAKILVSHEPLIIIGARSALFSPVRNLGLIVVDESHETAYKQDQAPYYHATTIAAKLANLHKALLVLGSATPLVSDYYIAGAKGRPIIRMKQTASVVAPSKPSIEIVDLRDKSAFTRSPNLSEQLLHEIEASLLRKEQILLFLNKRGTAHLVFCDRCGWQALCPHCDLPLVYHGDAHAMHCHACTFRSPSPNNCPECGNPSIIFTSIGTKAVAEEVGRLFPAATVNRFDTDNKKSERIETIFESVRSGKIDILVGTQTVAKGLDLPKLGLVGVINADSSLFLPDFSARERTYQLLSQVIGRVGRGHRDGKVVIQTYAPNGAILQYVLANNWHKFYNDELEERRLFDFPPFCYLLTLTCRRSGRSVAESAAKTLANKLKNDYPTLTIEGPAPAFREKIQGKYQWQIIVKAKRRQHLLDVVRNLPKNWSYDIDPLNLL